MNQPTNSAFERAFEFLLRFEGERSQDKDDRGGLTIYGIAERYHPTACAAAEAALSSGDKRAAQRIAAEVYKKEYWSRINGEALRPAVAIALFDASVNLGVHRSVRLLQRSLVLIGAQVQVDGLIGPATISAANMFVDERVWMRINRLRLDCYAGLVASDPVKRKYLLGWVNRVVALGGLIDDLEER